MRQLRVLIEAEEHAKIMHWVQLGGRFECSGFGRVVRIGDTLYIPEVFMLEQDNTAGETKIKSQAIAKKLYDLRNREGGMNFWWHSHHTMSAFFSSTDYEAMEQLAANGWLLSTVFNADGDTQTAFYMTDPFPVLIDRMKLNVHYGLDDAIRKACEDEYVSKVTNYVPRKQWKQWKRDGYVERGQDYSEWWARNAPNAAALSGGSGRASRNGNGAASGAGVLGDNVQPTVVT